jgi:hypothetical protein
MKLVIARLCMWNMVELSLRCKHFIRALNLVIGIPIMIPGAPRIGFLD